MTTTTLRQKLAIAAVSTVAVFVVGGFVSHVAETDKIAKAQQEALAKEYAADYKTYNKVSENKLTTKKTLTLKSRYGLYDIPYSEVTIEVAKAGSNLFVSPTFEQWKANGKVWQPVLQTVDVDFQPILYDLDCRDATRSILYFVDTEQMFTGGTIYTAYTDRAPCDLVNAAS